MPALDEFELIRRLFAPLATDPGALNLTDDAALIDCHPGCRLVLTTDAIVSDVHFLAEDSPDLVARKLVRVNLSDLAAMGAEPKGILLAAAFPRRAGIGWIEKFAAGLAADCREFKIPLLGGDTVATGGRATFALTAVGEVTIDRELRRSTAKVGDRVWVSGTIGDGAFGLLAARGEANKLGPAHVEALRRHYHLPEPRLALGRSLVGVASAATDISDGLVGDLGHICETSGVGAVIEAAKVPLSDAVEGAIAAGLGQGLATALTGGDDYELLFTGPSALDMVMPSIATRLGLRLTAIGTIIAGSGVRVDGPDGKPLALPSHGYNHFGA